MNLGIRDGVALADALAAALAGGADSALDHYTESRRPMARDVVAVTDRLTRLATAPRALRPLRNAAMSMAGWVAAVRRALASRLSGLVHR
jgi:2-polyprenyl-6-methoxyphenol hydroxylase-like FAD-dependent oxidoreductase